MIWGVSLVATIASLLVSVDAGDKDFKTLCTSELKSPEDIKYFPMFDDHGDKKSHHVSLLEKNMYWSTWSDLEDKRDMYGFTFKQAIFSGCQNPDSGVGVYAGSPDSYTTFDALFDKIIGEYHDRQPGQMHTSDMNYRSLESKIG